MTAVDLHLFRAEFLRLLTEDSATRDRRRKEYNQAIFMSEDDGGHAVFTGTSLDMVMDKFDHAAKTTRRWTRS
jgi:hypothetical protein